MYSSLYFAMCLGVYEFSFVSDQTEPIFSMHRSIWHQLVRSKTRDLGCGKRRLREERTKDLSAREVAFHTGLNAPYSALKNGNGTGFVSAIPVGRIPHRIWIWNAKRRRVIC